MTSGAVAPSALSGSDWREWSSHRVAPLLQREIARWAAEFHWDQRWAFTHVEAAREAGRLPGCIVSDAAGASHGWVYFLRHADQLQIGTLVSDSAEATRVLVDWAVESPIGEDASVVFFSPDAPGLTDALQAHGVRTEPYDYLIRPAGIGALAPPGAAGAASVRAIEDRDREALARLMAAAYRDTTFLRPFVPTGGDDAWLEYVTQLIDTRGCGECLPEACTVADGPGATLRGGLLATRLDPHTGHIAQVVVDPSARGTGLASCMLDRALAALAAADCPQVSLLVARTNAGARRLYDARGFQTRGAFITGIRP